MQGKRKRKRKQALEMWETNEIKTTDLYRQNHAYERLQKSLLCCEVYFPLFFTFRPFLLFPCFPGTSHPNPRHPRIVFFSPSHSSILHPDSPAPFLLFSSPRPPPAALLPHLPAPLPLKGTTSYHPGTLAGGEWCRQPHQLTSLASSPRSGPEESSGVE